MSLIATAVKHMIAAGMDADAIVAAVADMEAEITPTKSKGAERQARYRERNKTSQSVTSDDSDANPSPLCPPLDKETPPTPPKEINPPPISPQPFPRLPIADAGLWADFLKNRKAKRLPNTATAHERLKRDLAAMASQTGWTEAAIFRACVERGWGGIYDPTDGAKPSAKPEAHKDFMRKRYAEAEPPPVVHAIE